MKALPGDPATAAFRTLRIVLPCFAAQNVVFGITYGAYGPLIASTEAHFGVSRTAAASGAGLFNFVLGILAPLVGALIARTSARLVMVGGAALSAFAYVGLAWLPSFNLVLVMYGVLGAGAVMLGVLGPVTLISRWFSGGRARMLGIVNLPIFMLIAPFAVGELLKSFDREAVLLILAACYAAIIPLLIIIPHGGPADTEALSHKAAEKAELLSTRAIISRPAFWILSLAIGCMAGGSAAFVVHIVPFGTEHGLTLQIAAMLVSTFAAMGVVGQLLFGWLADRLNATRALAIATGLQAFCWAALLLVPGALIFPITGLMGMCLVPVLTLHGAAIGDLVPPASVSRSVGISYLIKLPFIFSFAPLAGWLYERGRDYRLPFLTFATLMAAATLMLITLAIRISAYQKKLAQLR